MSAVLQFPVVFGGAGDAPDIPVFDFASSPITSLIQIALIFVIPLLVGLVTDRLTDPTLKVILHGGLAFVTAFLNGLLDSLLVPGTDFNWINALANGLITWILGIVVHLGVWRPSGATARVQASTALQLFGPSSKRGV